MARKYSVSPNPIPIFPVVCDYSVPEFLGFSALSLNDPVEWLPCSRTQLSNYRLSDDLHLLAVLSHLWRDKLIMSDNPERDSVYERFLKNIDSVAPPLDANSISPQHGLYIPQRRYGKGSGRDHPENQGLILFFRQDGSHFPLSAALLEDYSGLVLRDLPVPGGYTLTLRIEWPGYPPRDFQLRARDWCHSPNRIPASKLGTEVAKAIRTFIQKMQGETINPEYAEWRVGPSGIKVEDLRIASLEQVSAGSWQARLFYKPS